MAVSVSQLISGIKAMPDETKRKMSAIIGAVVADAASLPLQWIYDDKKMKDIVGDKSPEFWPESNCPFFCLPTGSSSCYTDEMSTTLACLASDGNINTSNIATAIQTKFGAPDSPYQIALSKRPEKKYPISGPWLNSGVIKSLDNMKNGLVPPGSDSCEDNDGFALALSAFLLNLDVNTAKNDVANLLTTDKTAMSHFPATNLIVANFVTKLDDPIVSAKNSIASDYPDVAKEMEDVIGAANQGLSVQEIVNKFGKACGLPGSFQGALGSLLLSQDYVSAVRNNILAGGDCCARANIIGAALGAKFGIEAIPMEWIEKVSNIGIILENTVKVFASSK